MAARSDELTRFVREALQHDTARPEIERVLLEAGWDPQQVHKALAGFADTPFPVPVPRPVPHVSAGEAFLYLVLFTALGVTALSVVELFFALIEYLFYDPASSSPGDRTAWAYDVRWAVARALIAFPVFLIASWLVERSLRRDPAERDSGVRRWLTYAAMFLAVLVIVGDFITLVAYVLAGGTTARFVLKVVVVALVAGLILGYYLWDLRRTERARRPVAWLFLGVAGLAWVVAVGSGLWLMGSPSEQADRRVDERRLQDLRSLARAVDRYYEQNSALPQSLGALNTALRTTLPLQDPETNAPYRYARTGDEMFELCADFAQPSQNTGDAGKVMPDGPLLDSVWAHGAGPQCFTLDAGDPAGR
ncbi:DUF5671 domain-containing protein [Mycolicibacterium palauense]|uniref:DUF5671 domain-containing protein n=1 Tax=Mycolicibacterium palauense TaxID=2034511 RepID=UPI00159BAFBA|nr:DUF5671 domain-containing protein [Mycolicibacterium palauense]